MVLIIILAIAIVLQIFAAYTAIRLTRVTKFNSSWVLITFGLVLLLALRIDELLKIMGDKYDWEWHLNMPDWLNGWIGVGTSLCFALGVFMVKKVLYYMMTVERHRRDYENRLLNAVIRAEENQRQIFSKELHDGLGPLLSAAKMSITALSIDESDTTRKQILDNAEHTLNMAVKSLREISSNLSPHVLESFGLSRALENFIARLINPVLELKINFSSNLKNQRFDPQHEIVAYRVICELINNTIKHSEANLIEIKLEKDRNTLYITYMDNGKGFDPDLQDEQFSSGMGLSNARSRINSLNGTFYLFSAPDQGFKLNISLPI